MTSFWQDVRYSLRMIARAPGFAVIAILTLALGIGANTTIFSWINSALLNPVPGLAKPNEILSLVQGGTNDYLGFSYPDIQAMRDGQQSFSGIAACMFVPMSLTGKGKPERVWGMVASANYFDVLGVRPVMGRTFLPAEDEKPGGAPVAVISYRLWQTHFGANPNDGGPANRTQPALVHDCGRNAASVSGKHHRAAHGGVGAGDDASASDAGRRRASRPRQLVVVRLWTAEAGRFRGAGATGNDGEVEAGGQELSRGAQRSRQSDGVSAVAQSVQLQHFLLDTFADVDGYCRAGAAAGVRERGESDAGALGGSAARDRDTNVVGREPLAAGKATACGELDAVTGGRRGGAADYAVDRRNVDEICAGDGFSDLAGSARGPHRVAGDRRDLGADRRDLRNFACAACVGRGAGDGVERGERERVGRAAQGEAGERIGGGANFAVTGAAGVRGIVHSQLFERAENRYGIQSAERADRVVRFVYRGIFGRERDAVRSRACRKTGSGAGGAGGGADGPLAGIVTGIHERAAGRVRFAGE